MKIKIIIAALALILAVPAAAEMRLITQGFECSLDTVRLPQSAGGTIAYKPCADCDYRTNRVAPDVVWEFNGQSMRLEDFRERLALVENRSDRTITVRRHVESNRIIEVSINVVDSE
ncbi:MAG: hypothetical protein KJO82_03680 [Gammaproteobacteria bacterium]|nr:hypothetical protein [Gammaproteobacteria bacterium]